MHLSDGILSAPLMAGTMALAVSGMAVGLRKMDNERIPQVGILSAVFFIASLIHVPIGPASAHLMLTGLTGLLLGWCAFPAIGAALLLQYVLFGFGGLTSWGANVFNMAMPAVLSFYLFGGGIRHARSRFSRFSLGAMAGAFGILLSSVMLAGALFLSGKVFTGVAVTLLVGHVPVMIAEAIVTGSAVVFLHQVRPEMLER